MRSHVFGKSGTLRDAVEAHRAAMAQKLGAGEDGLLLGRANARFLEACFAEAFATAAHATRLSDSKGLALGAVGSFGRGAVALRSDADVALVVDPREVSMKQAGAFAEALLYPLWDATLSVGHQVLSAAEAISLAQKDLPTATALLDLRPLAGNRALLDELV